MDDRVIEAIREDRVLLSNSLMNAWTSCEQAAWFRYGLGWGFAPGRAMSVGSWFHLLAAADNIAKGIKDRTLLVVPEVLESGIDDVPDLLIAEDGKFRLDIDGSDTFRLTSSNVLDEIARVTYDTLGRIEREELDDHDSQPLAREYDLTFPQQVRSLYRRWSSHWEPRRRGEQVLLVEHRWDRDDENLTYGGKIDVVVRRSDGTVAVRDYKTTKRPPSVTYKLTNMQTVLYAWGIEPTLREHGVDDHVAFVELDYVVSKEPSLLRLKKPTKAQEEAGETGNPYANVGDIDAHSFGWQTGMMGENMNHPKYEKIKRKMVEWNDDTHPFFRCWESIATPTTVNKVLAQHARTWSTAKEVLLQNEQPARNLHPITCNMCDFATECAIDFKGGSPIAPMHTDVTLPVLAQ